MTLQERFLVIKERYSLNTNQLSKKAKVSRQAIANIEEGVTKDCKASMLANIAKELAINPSWILTGKGPIELTETQSDCQQRTQELEQRVNTLIEEVETLRQLVNIYQSRSSEELSGKLTATKEPHTNYAFNFLTFATQDIMCAPAQAMPHV